jgi:hypothetical protein
MGKILNICDIYSAYEDETGEYPIVPNNSEQTYVELLFKAKFVGGNILYKHGLFDWKIEVEDLQGPIGKCMYKRKTIIIDKSWLWLTTEDMLEDTIFHEVAHALCPGHGHDEVWQAMALEIGCNGQEFAVFTVKKNEGFTCQIIYGD